eukprot:12629837-Prorocentrum_lima.AAC.1
MPLQGQCARARESRRHTQNGVARKRPRTLEGLDASKTLADGSASAHGIMKSNIVETASQGIRN